MVSSANVELSKLLLKPLLKAGFPLLKSSLKTLAKTVLILRVNSSSISNRCSWKERKFLDQDVLRNLQMKTLIISNKEMKIVTSLEESGLLIKGVGEKNKQQNKKKQKSNLRTSWCFAKYIVLIRAGEDTIRVG